MMKGNNKKRKILYIGNNLHLKSNYNSSIKILSNQLLNEGYIVIISSDKKYKLFRLFDMCFSVYKNRKDTDYILIDTYSTLNFYYAFFVSQLSRILKLRYIPILRGGDLPNRLDKSKRMAKSIFNYSYKNIAPSLYLKKEFKERNIEAFFIPNILEISKYKYIQRKNIQPKLLWVRSIKQLYNPSMAVEVLHIVRNSYPEAILCMIGPKRDDSIETVINLVEKYKLENYFEFTGGMPAEEWHKKAIDFDIFINTTNIDNTPVSVMEAMALGLPVVSTNVGGIPFLIEDRIDGVLVEKDNPKVMAEAICKIIKENNQKLAVKARLKVENFDWEVVKRDWESILK